MLNIVFNTIESIQQWEDTAEDTAQENLWLPPFHLMMKIIHKQLFTMCPSNKPTNTKLNMFYSHEKLVQ